MNFEEFRLALNDFVKEQLQDLQNEFVDFTKDYDAEGDCDSQADMDPCFSSVVDFMLDASEATSSRIQVESQSKVDLLIAGERSYYLDLAEKRELTLVNPFSFLKLVGTDTSLFGILFAYFVAKEVQNMDFEMKFEDPLLALAKIVEASPHHLNRNDIDQLNDQWQKNLIYFAPFLKKLLEIGDHLEYEKGEVSDSETDC